MFRGSELLLSVFHLIQEIRIIWFKSAATFSDINLVLKYQKIHHLIVPSKTEIDEDQKKTLDRIHLCMLFPSFLLQIITNWYDAHLIFNWFIYKSIPICVYQLQYYIFILLSVSTNLDTEFFWLWYCCCILWVQEGVDSDKLQSSERTLKSRAIIGRSAANGIIPDQVECIFFPTCILHI